MRPVAQIPLRSTSNPLHLYRHLLREAGYLPTIVSPYITGHIKKLFHRRHERKKFALAKARMAEGRRQLHRLEDANAGHQRALLRIFLLSFGRIGNLSRKMIEPLVIPDAPIDSDAATDSDGASATSAQANAKVPSSVPYNRKSISDKMTAEKALFQARRNTKLNRNFLDRWDFDKLQNYLKTQIKHAEESPVNEWPHGSVSKSKPHRVVPVENIWGRPTPIRSIRSKLKAFWKKTLPKVYPPLGASEWEVLRSLASEQGHADLLESPTRRPVAVSPVVVEDDDGGSWSWEQYARHPSRYLVRRQDQLKRKWLIDPTNTNREISPGKMSRKLRRVCRGVFELSSHVSQNEHTLEQQITWGRVDKGLSTISPESRFLDGVDETGACPKDSIMKP